jgi:hypothetical protein
MEVYHTYLVWYYRTMMFIIIIIIPSSHSINAIGPAPLRKKGPAYHDVDCYLISPSLAAIGTAPNSVERKLLITSTTLCPFQHHDGVDAMA